MESNWINDNFSMPLLIGIIFIAAGLTMYFFPPKEINGLYGYRTTSSMSSKEKWDFAQMYSTKTMILCGGIIILTGIALLIFHTEKIIETTIGVGAAITTCIILVLGTERAIKNKFGK